MSGEEKKVPLSKKDKMKLRKERWLQKIEDIKLARKLQKAEAKRKATPVVGDMNPLMDALPELSDLVTVSKFSKPLKTQAKKTAANFSQMKPAQKRRVLHPGGLQCSARRYIPREGAKVLSSHLLVVLPQRERRHSAPIGWSLCREDDIAQFHKTLSDPLFKASPLALIGAHLSKRLKQEMEGERL
ncbi:UNVERIFIED_CONTAM: hypothetical protein K2H54_042407 [Gekko kuhli]